MNGTGIFSGKLDKILWSGGGERRKGRKVGRGGREAIPPIFLSCFKYQDKDELWQLHNSVLHADPSEVYQLKNLQLSQQSCEFYNDSEIIWDHYHQPNHYHKHIQPLTLYEIRAGNCRLHLCLWGLFPKASHMVMSFEIGTLYCRLDTTELGLNLLIIALTHVSWL